MRDRCWLWRWMMTLARPMRVGPAPASPISEAALLIALSGLRSSWPSMARNSSLAWFCRSAAWRSSISRVRRLLVAVSSVVRWRQLVGLALQFFILDGQRDEHRNLGVQDLRDHRGEQEVGGAALVSLQAVDFIGQEGGHEDDRDVGRARPLVDRSAVSKPSMPGMFTSSRITAKSCSSTWRSASWPERARRHPTCSTRLSRSRRACVLYVFRTLVDDDIPLDAGWPCAASRSRGRRARCLSPRFPAAVAGGNVETSQTVVNCLLRRISGCSARAQGYDEQSHLRQ